MHELHTHRRERTRSYTNILEREMTDSSDYSFQRSSTYQSVSSVHPHNEKKPFWQEWRPSLNIFATIFAWWMVSGFVFAYFEAWTFTQGIYFAFISMTGIGLGDFLVTSSWSIEFWWVFLFNAVYLNLHRCRLLRILFRWRGGGLRRVF